MDKAPTGLVFPYLTTPQLRPRDVLSPENAWTKVKVLPALPQTGAQMRHEQCFCLLLGHAEQQLQRHQLGLSAGPQEGGSSPSSYAGNGTDDFVLTLLSAGWEHHNLCAPGKHYALRPGTPRSNPDQTQGQGWGWCSIVMTFSFCWARHYLCCSLVPH